MHVIIGGCGRVGAELADDLATDGHDVVVVDIDASSFERMGSTFNGQTVAGDITDKDLMVRVGIEQTQAFAAVTQSDNANLMAVQIATELFGVPHTVARLFNPQREASYRKMGVRYVSETSMIARAVRNELRPSAFAQHVSCPDENVEVVEFGVQRCGHGVTIAEVESHGDVRVAMVQRGQRARIPKLDDRLQEGDVVVAAARRGSHAWIRRLVCAEDERGHTHRPLGTSVAV